MSRTALFDKQTIINAAFLVFKQKGTDYFTIRNIAKALNSSTSPIYYQFKSIEELGDMMIQEIVELFIAPVKDLENYYTYENLSIAFCLFAKNHRKLFEAIFLKPGKNSSNFIRIKLFGVLKKIMEQDENFDYTRDYGKLLKCDGFALNVFNQAKKMSEEDIKQLVKQYLFDNP